MPLGAGDPIVEQAKVLFEQHATAISRVGARLDQSFVRAVEIILACSGRLVVCGMGKSGHVARKMAATFASTGTPSFFLHAGEASHGDLGMVMPKDVVVLVSHSGETEEVLRLVPYFRASDIAIIAIVGNLPAPLAQLADVVLDVSIEREACPLELVPTTSAIATLAMGDALASSLIRARNFQLDDFVRLHPGGAVIQRLVTRVRDVMQKDHLPFVTPDHTVSECLMRMTEGRCGLGIVLGEQGKLEGLVTDGDVRRALQRHPGLLDLPVRDMMTKNPVTIEEDATLREAEERMTRLRLKALVVLGDHGRVSGVIEIFAKK
jgi:arabinose-5-phosphate isomerase